MKAPGKEILALRKLKRRLRLEGIRPLDNRLSAARFANGWAKKLRADPTRVSLAEAEDYLAILKLTFAEYRAWVLTHKHMTGQWRVINTEMRLVGKQLKDALADYNTLTQQARRAPIPVLASYIEDQYKQDSQPQP